MSNIELYVFQYCCPGRKALFLFHPVLFLYSFLREFLYGEPDLRLYLDVASLLIRLEAILVKNVCYVSTIIAKNISERYISYQIAIILKSIVRYFVLYLV